MTREEFMKYFKVGDMVDISSSIYGPHKITAIGETKIFSKSIQGVESDWSIARHDFTKHTPPKPRLAPAYIILTERVSVSPVLFCSEEDACKYYTNFYSWPALPDKDGYYNP